MSTKTYAENLEMAFNRLVEGKKAAWEALNRTPVTSPKDKIKASHVYAKALAVLNRRYTDEFNSIPLPEEEYKSNQFGVYRVWTKSMYDNLLSLREKGNSLSNIADIYGVSRTTISNRLRKASSHG